MGVGMLKMATVSLPECLLVRALRRKTPGMKSNAKNVKTIAVTATNTMNFVELKK
jgi:hypothetical protein